MKRKNLNVVKLENVIQDKKFFTIYSKLKSVLSKNKSNGSLAVAISGGSDSIALAFLSKCYALKNNTKSFSHDGVK